MVPLPIAFKFGPFGSVAACVAVLACASTCVAQVAVVRLGDPQSEKAAHVVLRNAGEPERDSNGLLSRRLEAGGSVRFEVACDPTAVNYLTVRLSGSEKNPNYLFVVQPDGAHDLLNPVPETRWGDLDHASDTPPFPGGYYYSTYDLPIALTRGRTSVRLCIESRGPFTYYGGHEQKPQTVLSKAIYLIASHVDPFVRIKEAPRPRQGATQPAATDRRDGQSAQDFLRAAHTAALQRMLTWQVWGDSYRSAVAFSPAFPPMLEGAFVTHTDMTHPATDDHFRGREGWTQDQWLDSVTDSAINFQNWCPMMAVALLGDAYVYPTSPSFQHNPEMLDRLFKALDFWCLAQGAGGEFAVPPDGPNKGRWIGAASDHSGHRRTGYNWDLQANGVPSLARGFITVYNDIVARNDPAELRRLDAFLDARVDSDNVGHPTTTRRGALARLYASARTFFTQKPGHDYFDPRGRSVTPSQGFNLSTLYSLNRALQLLESSLKRSDVEQALPAGCAAWPTAAASDQLPMMFAERMGEMVDGERWLSGSDSGLSYEGGASGGGYDGNYGMGMQDGLDDLARLTQGDPLVHGAVVDRLRSVLAGYSHFYRRDSIDGHPALAGEYVISARNIYNGVRPAYSVQPFAALTLGDPNALRRFQWFDQDGKGFDYSVSGGPFVYYQMMDLAALANQYAALVAKVKLAPPLPLPMEEAAPDFVWGDVDAQCVVVKDHGTRLYVAFNWRRERWQINDLARIHCMTATERRVANVVSTHQGDVQTIPADNHDPRSRAPDGTYYDRHAYELMNALEFGPYLVVQNVSAQRAFTYDSPHLAGAIDCATGKRLDTTKCSIEPRTTRVFRATDR